MIEVRTSYDFDNFPAMDDVIHKAVGRLSDFSGSDFCGRDLGWLCSSEIEAQRIRRALRALGLVSRQRDLSDEGAIKEPGEKITDSDGGIHERGQ